MKLYAKIKSERAEKGQGGNKQLEITVTAEINKIYKNLANIFVYNDKDQNQYLITFVPLGVQEYADQKGKSVSLENKTRRWCVSQ